MRSALFLFLLATTVSCTRIVFDVPQPRDVTSLQEFPGAYVGAYVHEGEQDSIIIDRSGVTFTEYREVNVSRKELETMSNIILKDGLLYDTELPQVGGVPYTIEDTLLRYAFTDYHTVGISDTLVIKEIKSYLVVSAKFSEDKVDEYWDVYVVRRSNSGDLVVSSTGNVKTPDSGDHSGNYDGDLDDYNKITPYERLSEDTYLFRPNKKAFLKLVKQGLFSSDETYQKVR